MLQVKNLSYEVVENGQKLKIIDDISFDVADGELLVNGGGKSTMASLLMGIKPQTAGQIILDGEDITAYDIDHRAKAGLGFAFQQPPRFKGMTVKHLIQLSSGGELSEDESCQLLSNVGLCAREYLDRQVDGSLSGGEMKRIEIATAFSKPHKLCIFDEPEAGIDLWSFSMLVQQFEEIHKKKKESIIIISHQERIIQMADRIMVIRDGRVQQIGTKEEVMPLLLEGDGDAGCKYMKH